MSERVPEGWKESKIRDFVNVGRGYAFKGSDYRSDGNPIVRVTNISETNGLDLFNDVVYLAKDRAEEFESYLLRDDDFLLVMVGATVGKYARVITKGKLLFLNQNMWRLSVIDAQTNSQKFALYGLQKVVEQFLRTMQGSAREFLTQKEFSKASIFVPPLPEQKKIAFILNSVDEVIENTQKQIDKLQDLKKAAMNDLLTKGIGHTDFKDSELGRIPKSWEVVRLGDTGKWQGGATPSKSNHEFWNGNIPWVSPKDMKSEYISQTEDYVSETAVRHSSTNLIDAGAILIVVRSGILKHTLPVAISRCDLTVNQDMRALSVGKNFSNLFIYHFLVSQNHLVLRSTLKAGNTVESIDAQVFSNYLLPKPPLAEQLEIAYIVETIASQIRKKTNKLSQTQALKKSLMQDLLTGKVRVQVN